MGRLSPFPRGGDAFACEPGSDPARRPALQPDRPVPATEHGRPRCSTCFGRFGHLRVEALEAEQLKETLLVGLAAGNPQAAVGRARHGWNPASVVCGPGRGAPGRGAAGVATSTGTGPPCRAGASTRQPAGGRVGSKEDWRQRSGTPPAPSRCSLTVGDGEGYEEGNGGRPHGRVGPDRSPETPHPTGAGAPDPARGRVHPAGPVRAARPARPLAAGPRGPGLPDDQPDAPGGGVHAGGRDAARVRHRALAGQPLADPRRALAGRSLGLAKGAGRAVRLHPRLRRHAGAPDDGVHPRAGPGCQLWAGSAGLPPGHPLQGAMEQAPRTPPGGAKAWPRRGPRRRPASPRPWCRWPPTPPPSPSWRP